MANTISALYLDMILATAIETLKKAKVPLAAFSSDYSDVAIAAGPAQSYEVPLIGDPSTQAHTGDYTANADTTDATAAVTPSEHPVSTFHFSDIEAMQLSRGVMTESAKAKVAGAIHGVVDDVIVNVLELALNANYASSEVITAANFDAAELATERTAANIAGFAKAGRAIVIGSDYVESLMSDTTIMTAFARLGNAAIAEEGFVPRVLGFDIYEYDNVPANGENLEGIICDRRAAAVVVRPVEVSQPGETLFTEVITDEETGVSVTYTVWFDRNSRKTYHNVECRHGAAVGRNTAWKRVLSA